MSLADLGEFAVRGTRESLRVYRLEGVGARRTRLDVARARGFSRFVGRADEMAVLEVALARTLEGHGQVVGVVAEPGVGKSRLLAEFAERCRARGIRVSEGHGVAHGKAIPLLPWLELRRHAFGVTEQDSDEAARDRIAGHMLRLDPDLADGVPLMLDFLGVPDPQRPAARLDAAATQRQLVDVTTRLMRARSARGEPAVAVLEDLHWFDPASEAFLAATIETLGDSTTLLLCAFRPGYHAAWMEKAYYLPLALHPLGPDALVELCRDLLGSDPSLAALGERLRSHTAGNPFFVEEVVQALVEDGSLAGTRSAYRLARPVEELAIPPTVQAVLAARIDRLPEREKAVLQSAAVIGRELPEPALRRIVELPPADLGATPPAVVAAEFLYEAAPAPEAAYAFKHPLTQEVAYRSQLAERRAHVHGAVARAFEALYADRLDERAALLAHHWEGAREPLTAARWHARAADWVAARDRGGMLRHWRRVRELLADGPESQETLALRVRACRHLVDSAPLGSGEDPGALFAEGMALAARLDDPAPRIRLLNVYANSLTFSGELAEAEVRFRESLALADRSGSAFLRFLARVPLTRALVIAGRLGDAVALSEEAELLGRDLPELASEAGLSPYGLLLVHQGNALAYLGRLAGANRAMEQAIALARERKEVELQAFAHLCRVVPCDLLGEAEPALAHARRAVELAEAGGNPFLRGLALSAFGGALVSNRRWAEAVEALMAALAVAREQRVLSFVESDPAALLAEAHLGAGDPVAAGLAAATAVALARQLHRPVAETRALLAQARALLAADHTAAAAALDAAAALVAATGARIFAPFIHVERAAVARLGGDPAGRGRELDLALRLFTELGAPLRAAEVRDALGG